MEIKLRAMAIPKQTAQLEQGKYAGQRVSDVGESSPEKWEKPLGAADVHVVIVAVSPDTERLEEVLERARQTYGV